ncbi:MAG: nitroreductase family protein [Anaerolineae bacterium]|nr:nitroreductase family protein [Anaerolineae bacterium]
MDFWQVIRSRHSVREYAPDQEVTPDLINGLLSAAIEAPSAGNCQSWHFVVVRDPALRAELAHAALDQMFLAEAPVVIVVCADPERSARRYRERGRSLYTFQDTAAATENLLLAATALGLGACWVGAFDERQAHQVLRLPPELIPVAMVPVGYPLRPSSRETTRRPLSEVVTYL